MNSDKGNNTLIDEIMQCLILEKEQAFPKILAKIYDQTMLVERENHLGAGTYERTDDRIGYANGFKPRTLQTRVGKLNLRIPQVRGSESKFYPNCLTQGQRVERALCTTAAEMYVHGVSTRKVETVFKAMGVEHFSAEQVSKAAKELDAEITSWRTRPINQCVKVIYLDATYQKVRVDG